MPNQKEYRVCMPLTVEEYRVGQLYMINKHSLEQSEKGEGVEIIKNEPYYDEVHGQGQFTEKRVHLNSKLPKWIQGYCPKVFYIIEKAWNYYPYTVTEYECSFIPRFNVLVKTCYLNDNGSTENALGITDDERKNLEVEHLDIAFDPLAERYYKAEEDPRYFQSAKTGRGPLVEGWRMDTKPIMCSYKYVRASFEVWGLAGTVESYVHSTVKDILIGGHRQAFAWIDEWHGMTLEDVRAFEEDVMKETNIKVVGVDSMKELEAEQGKTSENQEKSKDQNKEENIEDQANSSIVEDKCDP